MRKINKSNKLKKGDWILFKPKEEDGRMTLLVIGNKEKKLFAYNTSEELMQLGEWDNMVESLFSFYEKSWNSYKLNKKEKIRFKREIILENLK